MQIRYLKSIHMYIYIYIYIYIYRERERERERETDIFENCDLILLKSYKWEIASFNDEVKLQK